MPDNPRRDLAHRPSGGVFHELALRIKLILRLMADRRVSPLLKLLPLASLAYLFVPDWVPGPLDDVAMIGLLSYLFIELCPPEIVAEHMRALTSVIDAEWREIEGEHELTPPE